MTRLSIFLILLALPAAAQTLTQGDRDFAMSAMHASRKQFLDALENVSAAQWKWKPAADVWSVPEIAEHIALSDELIPQVAGKAMQAPAAPEKKKPNPRETDSMLAKTLPVRDKKFQAPESIQPTGRYADKAAIVQAFKTARDRNIAYIRDTQEDLRSHFATHPVFGELDVCQWYVLMGAHTERHVNQIKEVMANPGFPKQ